MNKQQVHHYVLEHISGSLKARQDAKPILGLTFGIALASSIVILLSNSGNSNTVGLAFCILLAGVPFGGIAQRSTLRVALSRESLRLKRFLIGKKGYVAPKDHVLHEHADLFAIAANLVCQEPFFSPQSNAAAWHTYGAVAGAPGVAAYVGWYGDTTKASIFLYGDLAELTAISSDIWDLGHVRKLSTTDKERFIETSKGWKRQQLIPVALGYAPLPTSADPTNLSLKDIQESCILLGALGLEGTRGGGQTMPISPSVSIRKATNIQITVTMSLAFFAVVSALGSKLFTVSIPVNPLLILAFSLFLSPLLLAVFSWDHATKETKKTIEPISSLIWDAALISGFSYGVYLLYLYWQGSVGAVPGSAIHQTGTAVAVLTFGLCTLLHVSLNRPGTARKFKINMYNPLFLLAWASSLLLILIISYGTGPLLVGGILMALGTTILYGLLYELRAYADRHHSREHILELLKAN